MLQTQSNALQSIHEYALEKTLSGNPLQHVYTNIKERLRCKHPDGLDIYRLKPDYANSQCVSALMNTPDGNYMITIRKIDV